MTTDLRVSLGSLTLPNPVLVAAGTFGYGVEFQRALHVDQLGGLVTKTLTRAPRTGNPPPRLVETPSGMLNSVGLQNPGLDAFLRDILPGVKGLGVPVIVSVLGESPDDVACMVRTLDGADGVDAIELNLSCPNLNTRHETGDMRRETSLTSQVSSLKSDLMVAQDPEATEAVVRAARAATRKPLIAKLSPDVTDITPIARAAEGAGADALAVGNTFTGMSLDPVRRGSRLGSMTGGLSGPAIRPLAVYRVWRVARAVRCPVVGIGGIVTAEDAMEFLLAGATAVAVGTATFADPSAPLKVLRGLHRYLTRTNCPSLRDVIGRLTPCAQPPRD